MMLDIGGERISVTPENSLLCYYPNDMLDCLYVDMGESYFILHKDNPAFPEVREGLSYEGVNVLNVTSYNESQPPHCFVLEGVVNLVIARAEKELDI